MAIAAQNTGIAGEGDPETPHKRRGEILRVSALVAASVTLGTLISALTDEKMSFLYKEDMHLSATTVTLLNLLLALPTYLQFFIGAWTDIVPWLGSHRRSYYVGGTLIAILSFLPLAFMHTYTVHSVAPLLLASGAGGVLASVVYDAVIVAVGNRTGTYDRLQSLAMVLPLILGAIYTSHFGGHVAEDWSYQRAFGTAAALSVLNLPLVWLMDEPRRWTRAGWQQTEAERQERQERLRAHRTRLRAAIRHMASSRKFWVFTAFIGYIALAPAPLTALLYYETDSLHFSKQFIGNLDRFDNVGTLIGLGIWALCSRRIQVRYLAWGYFLCNLGSYFCFLGIHGAHSAGNMMFVGGLIGAISDLCSTLLMARACPPELEATIWGLLGSVNALFGQICDAWGSWIYDANGPAHHFSAAHGWRVSVWFGFGIALLACVFIPFLPDWTKSRRSIRDAQEALPVQGNEEKGVR